MTETPDEAQAATAAPDKPAGQTARQVADHALRVAQAVRDGLEGVTEQLVTIQARISKALPTTPALQTRLDEGMAAMREEIDGFQKGILRRLEKAEPSGAAIMLEEDALSDQVTALVHTAMRPIIESANTNMAALVDRVQALEVIDGQRADAVAQVTMGLESSIGRIDQRLEVLTESVELADQLLQGENNLQERVNDLEELSTAGKQFEVAVDVSARLDALEKGLAERVAAEIERRSDSPGWLAMAEGDVELRLQEMIKHELDNRPAPKASPYEGRYPEPAVGGVHAKVLELMRAVTAIGKDKEANAGEGGRFKFRGIDAAMDAVGHAMRAVGLTLETEVLSTEHDENPVTKTNSRGETRTVVWSTTRLVVRYTFVDPTDGSRHSFQGAGEGRDASDKSTSKAMSMALKYGLFQALMIPVEGLDESDGEAPTVSTEHPPQPSQQPSQAPPAQPPANRPPSQDEMARGALAALRAIDRQPPDKRPAELARILNKITETGLATVVVEDATLAAHAIAISRTLTAPEQAAMLTGERNPWTDAPMPPAPDDYPPSM